MTRWKKEETEFKVSVNTLKSQNNYSKMCVIPKPIIEMLDEPDSYFYYTW